MMHEEKQSMQVSLRELLFWTAALAVGLATGSIAIGFVILVGGLARIDKLLPPPYGTLVGVLVIVVLVWLMFPSLKQITGG